MCCRQVGAKYETLRNEAHTIKIKCRMQETKGQLPFDTGLMHFLATNHGGLNEYGDAGWVRRDPSNQMNWPAGEEHADRIALGEHATPEEVKQHHHQKYEKIFTSALTQR